MDCIPWAPWTRIFCCCWSLPYCNSGILSSYGHLLDNYYLYILRLLDCGSRSCHSCGIFSFDCCIYFPYRLLVIASSCYYTRLRHLRICLLCPFNPKTVLGLILPISSTRSPRRNPSVKASIARSSKTSTAEFLMMLHL
jgi:hypothetical protein